ncbi:MAG: hypothetical protein JST92_26640, partial [Deltaproteobacteria bacterium]|nr:hypothetical protein [Deltaproteobacteria bacterium]
MFALLALALLAAGPPSTVKVEVLGLFHTREATVTSQKGSQRVWADGDKVKVADAPSIDRARFEPGGQPVGANVMGLVRTFDGALEVHAKKNELVLVNEVPVETYVASVVASEAAPESPEAALDALAIVVRSFALDKMAR